MSPKILDLTEAEAFLRDFAKVRDWEQFHSPKNLVMALSGETGELAEIFQWLTEEQSWFKNDTDNTKHKIGEELADILQYIIIIADLLSIDLNEALWAKLKKNDEKYPVELSRGTSKKYTEL